MARGLRSGWFATAGAPGQPDGGPRPRIARRTGGRTRAGAGSPWRDSIGKKGECCDRHLRRDWPARCSTGRRAADGAAGRTVPRGWPGSQPAGGFRRSAPGHLGCRRAWTRATGGSRRRARAGVGTEGVTPLPGSVYPGPRRPQLTATPTVNGAGPSRRGVDILARVNRRAVTGPPRCGTAPGGVKVAQRLPVVLIRRDDGHSAHRRGPVVSTCLRKPVGLGGGQQVGSGGPGSGDLRDRALIRIPGRATGAPQPPRANPGAGCGTTGATPRTAPRAGKPGRWQVGRLLEELTGWAGKPGPRHSSVGGPRSPAEAARDRMGQGSTGTLGQPGTAAGPASRWSAEGPGGEARSRSKPGGASLVRRPRDPKLDFLFCRVPARSRRSRKVGSFARLG